MIDLTDRQRKFCQLLVTGNTHYDSYRLAGYSVKCGRNGAEQNVKRLLKNDSVKRYIDELRAEVRNKAIWKRDQMLLFLCGVLELDISDLVDQDTGALKNVKESGLGPMLTKLKVTEKVNENGNTWGAEKEINTFSKEKAADLLIKIMGWAEPEKVEHSHEIIVKMGEPV